MVIYQTTIKSEDWEEIYTFDSLEKAQKCLKESKKKMVSELDKTGIINYEINEWDNYCSIDILEDKYPKQAVDYLLITIKKHTVL